MASSDFSKILIGGGAYVGSFFMGIAMMNLLPIHVGGPLGFVVSISTMNIILNTYDNSIVGYRLDIEKIIEQWPPLFFAACSGQIEAAIMLLEAGADTIVTVNDKRVSFLEVASEHYQTSFMRKIIHYQDELVVKAREDESLARAQLEELIQEKDLLITSFEKKREKCEQVLAENERNDEDRLNLNGALQEILKQRDVIRHLKLTIRKLERRLAEGKYLEADKVTSETQKSASSSQFGFFNAGGDAASTSSAAHVSSAGNDGVLDAATASSGSVSGASSSSMSRS